MDPQMLIVFLSILMVSSDSEEVKKLTVTEGGSITLPDPVKETGFLLFERKTLAVVDERKIRIYEKTFKGRVLWNNNTGLFTITGLQRNDSGVYSIESKEGSGFYKSYKLSVYESVPTPAVEKLNGSAESCSLLCSVNKTEETTLMWYKGEEMVNQNSSTQSLLLKVNEQDYSSSYRCVASNPAEEKTHSVNVVIYCSGQKKTNSAERHYYVSAIIIPIVSAVLVILVAFIIKWRFFDKNKKTYTHTQEADCSSRPDQEHGQI